MALYTKIYIADIILYPECSVAGTTTLDREWADTCSYGKSNQIILKMHGNHNSHVQILKKKSANFELTVLGTCILVVFSNVMSFVFKKRYTVNKIVIFIEIFFRDSRFF